jgi:hypothetical protein
MTTIAELRAKVRSQTEQTSSELSDSTIDSYLQEAFNRTIAVENKWPFYEKHWDLTLAVGQSAMAVPSDLNRPSVLSLVLVTTDAYYPLRLTDYETADALYAWRPTASLQSYLEYSFFEQYIYLWPASTFAEETSFILRGYRLPTDWLAGPSTTEVDADERLHLPLAHYAIALSYEKQEADGLADKYMERWQRDVEAARQAIMEPSRQLPLVMGGGTRRVLL